MLGPTSVQGASRETRAYVEVTVCQSGHARSAGIGWVRLHLFTFGIVPAATTQSRVSRLRRRIARDLRARRKKVLAFRAAVC